jgi:hypothetical protein
MMMSPGGGTVNRWIDCLFFWLRLLFCLCLRFFLVSFLVSLLAPFLCFSLRLAPPLTVAVSFFFSLCYFRRYAYFSASSHGVVQMFMVTVLILHMDLKGSVGWFMIKCN